jgi:hypothetical protein
MNASQIAAVISVALFAQEAPTKQDKASEEVRAAYSQFVDRLNAIATSVTADVWTPEFVGRVQGIDRGSSASGLAIVSIDRMDVIEVKSRSYAVLFATRTIQWPKSGETPEETTHDSVLAVLVRPFGAGWQVACQLALSPSEEIKKVASKTAPQTSESQRSLEAILDTITSHDTHAVEQGLSQRAGRCLRGEIGRFLRGATKMELRGKEVTAVACSDDTSILVARTRIRELSPNSDSNVAGWLTIAQSLYVLRRASDKSWKVELEIYVAL